uniref:Polyphosphate kinase n=1 Tax=uncultured Thiotrichaceae bacterium TaxID=298394 RepID=A0A6S6UFC4_9GAMM|nr:MAG: Polyphosphate kinase (EC [uncultured Thiotrichaceae bacterium]
MTNFENPDYYINRELGLLAFNRRVLELAKDKRFPLLERLRFLCISSSNLDEFFEVRVGSLKQQKLLGLNSSGPDGLVPDEALQQIAEASKSLVERQYSLLNKGLIPELEKEGVHFVRRTHWNTVQQQWVSDYFDNELMPLLSPFGLDPAHPFPNVINKSLNFITELDGTDAFGRKIQAAIVQAPRTLPRIIRLPTDIAPSKNSFVFLSSILHAFIDRLFPGMTVEGCYQFRVTRNSNMYVDEEEIDDLLKAMKGELPHRHFGAAVRLEVADHCPEDSFRFLQEHFELEDQDVYQVDGPVNLNRLMNVIDLIDKPKLRFASFTAGSKHVIKKSGGNIFKAIRKKDILSHYPYQSFNTMLKFVDQASTDKNVLAIKLTLYRAGKKSALVESLIRAARKGKEVTAVVELRARFDEEANIELSNRLQQANVHVVYGVVGYKTHAKMCLVVRREGDELVRYANLATGNYHAGTAKAYTDFGLMTCHYGITEDVHNVFHMLTGLGRVRDLNHLLEAPFRLHTSMLEKIEREAECAKAGKPAHIMVRMNSLIEPQIIKALYRASCAGVKIDLVVRGICCLQPGIEGVSENIHVRSVMGRFLEHPRVYYFLNDGAEEMYCSSADWMPRNFFRRVEIAFPILDVELRRRVRTEAFEVYLQDNTHAWVLQPDGSYQRIKPKKGELRLSAQNVLMDSLGKHAEGRGRLLSGDDGPSSLH